LADAPKLKLLLHSLRAFGSALEMAGNWRRAANVYGQLRTLSTRLLGKQHKATRAATQRARRAQDRVSLGVPPPHQQMANNNHNHNASSSVASNGPGSNFELHRNQSASSPATSPSLASGNKRGGGGGGRSPLASSANRENQRPAEQKSPEQLTGDESWLN